MMFERLMFSQQVVIFVTPGTQAMNLWNKGSRIQKEDQAGIDEDCKAKTRCWHLAGGMSNRLWRIEYREAGAVSMTLGGDPTVLGDTFYIDFQ